MRRPAYTHSFAIAARSCKSSLSNLGSHHPGCSMFATRFLTCAVGVFIAGVGSPAFSQVAVLHNGVEVTLKLPLQPFACEGPIWDIDAANHQMRVVGYLMTFPASLNGLPFTMSGTGITGIEDFSEGPITTLTFDRLTDFNAANRDVVLDTAGDAGPVRLGPARSIISLGEARSSPSSTGLHRSPQTEKAIEDNFFFIARNAFLSHPPGKLPANFLGYIGIRTETGGFPLNNSQLPPRRYWRYPTSAGATVIANGHVYVDNLGREYNIPDVETLGGSVNFGFSENVLIGHVTSAALGNYNTPDSFVVGGVLVLMNQDPRTPLDIYGTGLAPVSKAFFGSYLSVNPGAAVSIVGHMIGEHVLMAEEIEVDGVFDPAIGAWVSTIDNQWKYQPGAGLSYRGSMVPFADHTLAIRYGNIDAKGVFVPGVNTVERSLQANLTSEPLSNSASFNVRDQAGGDANSLRAIRFTVTKISTGEVVREQVYDWATLVGL